MVEEVVSLLLKIKSIGLSSRRIEVFVELFEGLSGIDPGLCHLVQHLTVTEPCKVCRSTYSPMPVSDLGQRLYSSLLIRLQCSWPKRFVRGGRFCAAFCSP